MINNYIFIFIGFNKIINRNVINYPKFGSYNLHAGYLPKYRGASPIVYQLLNNEKYLENENIYRLAKDIIYTQKSEIETMKNFL